MRTRVALAAAALVCLFGGLHAQQKTDPGIQKVADQYLAAYNKGDVKALVALYTDDAMRVSPDGSFVTGKAAIEKGYQAALGGGGGGQLPLKPGQTLMVTADVAVIEGTFEVASTPPARGRYVNTIVRKAGSWKLASVVTIPER